MSDDLVTVQIDGHEVQLPAGKNLLEALLARDVNLPYFCWHPALGSIGACRQCGVVQYRNPEDTRGRIMMACMTPVTEGARFSLQAPNAVEFRKSVIEGLMISHPHDCPVCEEGGECHLQDMTVMTGHRDRRYRGKKVTHRNQYLGPLLGHEMNRCITCYRCVRFYQDYAGGNDLAAFGSRDHVYFGRAEDGVLTNEFAGNLVEVCPTGVFTDKPLGKLYTRKWDLESSPSVCTGCALGCGIMVATRYGEFRRIHNRYNHRINGYFLCDRGRFGGSFVSSDTRFRRAGVRNAEGKYDAIGADEVTGYASRLIADSARVIGIGSPRASLEANHALMKLVGSDNYWSGMNRSGADTHALMLEILRKTPAQRPTMAETEDYDAVLVLGEDVTNHAPRLALSLRQATRNRAKELAKEVPIAVWDDAAVRKRAQHELSPLILVTPMADRLDDVATQTLRVAPDRIAAVGFDIAHALDPSFPGAAANETQAGNQDLDDILRILQQAKKPLIVAGTSLRHTGILKAAANIAAALTASNEQTGIMLCADECNSMGVAMMAPAHSLESIIDGNSIDTAIVLENDLTRRLSPRQWRTLRDKVNHLIVIDSVDNETISASEVVLPAATIAESEGTLVNNEGTAQRAFAALPPVEEVIPAWRWLVDIGQLLKRPGFDVLALVDDVTADCAATHPALAAIVDAAPQASYRKHGLKIARQTHRASGRTAMYADKSVHDKKPPDDDDSALAFSMEGAHTQQPSALRPFVWSPGWNSNQSINKFQAEIGGALKDGDLGIRLLDGVSNSFEPYANQARNNTRQRSLQIVRRHHIFGSDELSSLSEAVAELTPRAYCAVGTELAEDLSVSSGDGIEFDLDGALVQLEVLVDESLASGCVALPVGLVDTRHLSTLGDISLHKAVNWERRQPDTHNIIGSDRLR